MFVLQNKESVFWSSKNLDRQSGGQMFVRTGKVNGICRVQHPEQGELPGVHRPKISPASNLCRILLRQSPVVDCYQLLI